MEVALQQGVTHKVVGRAQQLLQRLWKGEGPAVADGVTRLLPSPSSPSEDHKAPDSSSSSDASSSSSSSSQSVGASSSSSVSTSSSSEKTKKSAPGKAVEEGLKLHVKHWKIGGDLMNQLLEECRERAAAESKGERRG